MIRKQEVRFLSYSHTGECGDTYADVRRKNGSQRPVAGMKRRPRRENIIHQQDVRIFSDNLQPVYLKGACDIASLVFAREFGLGACTMRTTKDV